jgi:hypothetical protein
MDSLVMTGAMPILLDDETTWPSHVRELLDAGVSELPAARADLCSAVDAQIRDLEVVGYHCTRLTTDEIERVKNEGLSPLTRELRQSRILARVEAGDLPRELVECLLTAGIANRGVHRLDISCFYLTKEIGDWCWKFFRYWGGESIYVPYMNLGSEEGRALRSIGCPCILELAVPVSVTSYQTVAGAFVYEHARRRNIAVLESSHDTTAASLRVLRVIEWGTPDFEKRESGVAWSSPIFP